MKTKQGHMTRIAILDQMLPPYRISLFNELATHQHVSVDVLLSRLKEADREWELDLGNAHFDVILFPGLYFPIPGPSRMGRFDFHYSRKLVASLKDQYDCIILSGYTSVTNQAALRKAWRQNIPTILWYRSFGHEQNLQGKLGMLIAARTIRRSTAIIVPCRRSARYAIELGAKEEDVFVVGNTVDNHLFQAHRSELASLSKQELRIALELPPGPIILFVGRVIKAKGLDELLIAAAGIQGRVSEASVVIAGSGSDLEYFREKRQACKLDNVYFIGHVDNPKLSQLYAAADVLILPSHYEPWGLVLNEAMNFSLPVVSTESVGASHEIVKNGVNGIVVPDRDSAAIEDALVLILQDGRMRDAMGEESLKIVAQHSPEWSARQIEAAISHALSKSLTRESR